LSAENGKKIFENFSFPYGFYSPEEYAPWLSNAGFIIVSLELKPKDMVHENIEKFKGWFRTTWLPYLYRIPNELREVFVAAVSEEYLKINPINHDGKIHTGMQRLEFEAKRYQ
jgi:trans-aconitate 2-methyltransferase